MYISVNALTPGGRTRTRTRTAIHAIRHVFLEADGRASSVAAAIEARPDLPPLSYVLHSSPNRAHFLWRVTGFTPEVIEALQRQLARELGTDSAATPCSQTTRLPGFMNHKYRPGHLVTIEYRSTERVYTPDDFPKPAVNATPSAPKSFVRWRPGTADTFVRAQRYLAAVPPAISGQHGDVHTFRVCCRVVRGFALSDEDAMRVLAEWNARCQPPWSERELADKLRRARRYGRERVAGLLEAER